MEIMALAYGVPPILCFVRNTSNDHTLTPMSSASSGPNDASAIVQNFLNSLKSGSMGASGSGQQRQSKPFTTLPDLLPSSTTIPIIESADSTLVNSLLSHLPPTILLLAQEAD